MKTFNLILPASFFILMFWSCSKDKDETSPVIIMQGNNPDSLIVKTVASYDDPGATATDDKDGDLTSKIVAASNVNVNVPGHYLVYYNVEDGAHNLAVKLTRNVYVVKADASYDASSDCAGNSTDSISITSYSNNDSITINNFYSSGTVIKAGLNNYKYTIVPMTVSTYTLHGDFSASGTTLNGTISLTGPTTVNCQSTFIRQ